MEGWQGQLLLKNMAPEANVNTDSYIFEGPQPSTLLDVQGLGADRGAEKRPSSARVPAVVWELVVNWTDSWRVTSVSWN